MAIVTQVLNVMWAVHPQRFWLMWFTITTASLIYIMSTVGHRAAASGQNTSRQSVGVMSKRFQIWEPKAIMALTFVGVFLASYIIITLVWEDFTYYDNDVFMLYTLKGFNVPPPIWTVNGRFFPFGLIDFNLIRHFTNTPIGYHMLPIVEIVIFFWILLILDAELSITARATLAILALLTPSILLSFGGLIFEERNVLFFLACLLLSLKQFDRTKAVAWAVMAVLFAQIMLYFKETSFLLLFALAAGRLILRCRDKTSARWDFDRLWDQESRLDFCLASLAVLFLLCYFAVMGVHGNTNYATNARRPIAEVVLDYFRLDLLVWLFVGVVVYRVYMILRHRTVPWLLWDALALGGVAWFLGYLYLGMFTAYYLAPADLVAILYVGRFVALSWDKEPSWRKMAVSMLAFLIVIQDLSLSTFTVFERKNVIHAKVETASVVEARNGSGNVPSLFFPFASPYSIMEFLVYLNYKGVPINSASLRNGTTARDGPCVDYRQTIICHAARKPAPGDLVIVLPDDEASLAAAAVYRERGELLLSYEPRPHIPRWLYPLIGSFPLATGDYKTRPDRWMDASVTVWR